MWEEQIAQDREIRKYKPIPEETLRKLFDHARWIASDHRAGRCLQAMDLDLANLVLDGVNLRLAQIPNVRLTGSSLKYAQLDGADLTDAAVMFCDLEEASFRGAQLKDALFLDSTYGTADFTDADTSGACWTEADIASPPDHEL